MTFSSNYYAVLKDTESGKGMAEVLVDRYSGLARPETGPNMMWNTRFRFWRGREARVPQRKKFYASASPISLSTSHCGSNLTRSG